MRSRSLFAVLSLVFIGIVSSGASSNKQAISKDQVLSKANSQKSRLAADMNFGQMPLYFIHNQDQVDHQARFYAKASRYTLWLTDKGLVFDSFRRIEDKKQKDITRKDQKWSHLPIDKRNRSIRFQRDVTRLKFVGANPNPRMIAFEEQKLRVNYFKGNDPAKWNCDVPTSKSVIYKNIYPDIDLKVYGIEKEIEYDWIVKPGADPEDIRFEYKNVKGTRIDKSGNLVIETEFGDMIHQKPISYQRKGEGKDIDLSDHHRSEVEVKFKECGKHRYGFEVGDYDKTRELIIDPLVLLYSTYLGGSGDEIGYGIALDSSSYAYIVGYTSSTDFPILDQYQGYQTGIDAFVTKIDTTQSGSSSLIFSTYLGGGGIDYGYDIALDSSGYAYIVGFTSSTDFPTLNQYQGDQPGIDAFVTKIDTSQSGGSSLLYSTYLGGNGVEYGYGIALDSSGYAYVTGFTDSTNFPALNQYQGDQPGIDAFVTKIDTTQSGGSSLLYSTFLGGSGVERGYGIAIDSSGYAYVTGYTDSSDFPALNQYQGNQGFYDAFVTKIDTTQPGSSSLLYSTFLGGGGIDNGYDIALDSSGNAYIVGFTSSSDFPTLDQYQGFQGGYDAFVTKIDTTQSGSSSLIFSTYLGGSGVERGFGIALDSSSNAYITGYTSSTDFPTLNQYMGDPGDSQDDAFVTKIDTTQSGGSSLIYSTFLGGNQEEWGWGIAVDSSGHAYLTGNTSSTDFPTLNQYMGEPGDGQNDAFVTKLIIEYIEVTSPNGGESWDEGAVHDITWSSTGIVGNVKIEYSIDNGTNWTTEIASTLNDGSYSWTVPSSPSTQCLVRISDAGDGNPSDTSDAVFTINSVVPDSITVTSPNGGEILIVGIAHDITWTSVGTTGNVKIEYSIDNGGNWTTITDSTENNGSFPWTVPNSPSSQCLVRISETDGNPSDTSNEVFTITPKIPPTVTTGAASSVTSSSATLEGTLNPNGKSTDYYFEYGLNTSYGTNTTSQNAGSGSADVPVSEPIIGLSLNTTYHFRLVATNAVGTTYGDDQTFTTNAAVIIWSGIKRITWNPGDSSLPSIATDPSNHIHVFWNDNSPGNNEIMYKKSTDGGFTWGTLKRLTCNSGSSQNPVNALDSTNVYLTWYDDSPGNNEIMFRKSTDGGSAWDPIKHITWNSGDSISPYIAVNPSNNNVHLTWSDNSSGNYEIMYKRSTDGGSTWGPLKQRTWNSGDSMSPYIAVNPSNNNVYLIWNDNTPGNDEIMYKRSTDGGSTWGPLNRITWNSGSSVLPYLAVNPSNNNVYLLWNDNTPGNDEIMYKKSTDGGSTWGPLMRMTWNGGDSLKPVLAVDSGNNVHIVWYDDTPGNYEIYYKMSTDGGSTWGGRKRITWNSGTSKAPAMAVDTSNNIYLTWQDNTPSNYEIYTKNKK